jgi:hypothetical protein
MMGNVGRREFVQGVGLVVGALAATAGYPLLQPTWIMVK